VCHLSPSLPVTSGVIRVLVHATTLATRDVVLASGAPLGISSERIFQAANRLVNDAVTGFQVKTGSGAVTSAEHAKPDTW
jgi:hypothetical protein